MKLLFIKSDYIVVRTNSGSYLLIPPAHHLSVSLTPNPENQLIEFDDADDLRIQANTAQYHLPWIEEVISKIDFTRINNHNVADS